MDELKIELKPGVREGIRIVHLSGPFTLQGLFDFQSIIRGISDPITIIDLTDVPYMDSASLGAMMGVHTSSQRHQRQYAVVGMSERLLTLFHVAGVDNILVTYPTVEEAQEKLSSKAAVNSNRPS